MVQTVNKVTKVCAGMYIFFKINESCVRAGVRLCLLRLPFNIIHTVINAEKHKRTLCARLGTVAGLNKYQLKRKPTI
jgi:hypothetical protein